MNKNTVTKSSGNVFVDLGFPLSEAVVMHIRVETVVHISQQIKKNGWTTTDAANKLGITPLDVDQLLINKVDSFSLDKLLILAIRTGLHVKLDWANPDEISNLF